MESTQLESFELTTGQFDNKVPVAWFERGQQISRAVARVLTPRGLGTGWLINGGYVITNNHVVESAVTAQSSRIQFDFELDVDGKPRSPKSFDVKEFLATSVELDYTILKPSGNPEQEYGFFDITEALPSLNGNANTQFPVVIQHPSGRRKEFSGFENELSHFSDSLVWYTSDTEPGSSGSPVLGGKDFRPFALHHASKRFDTGGQPKVLNEGILLSAIIADLVANHPLVASEIGLQSPESLLDDAAVLWLRRGRVDRFVESLINDDQELVDSEVRRLRNAFYQFSAPDDINALQDACSRLETAHSKEKVHVIVAAAGVAVGASCSHWAHLTRQENLEFESEAPSSFALDLDGFECNGNGLFPTFGHRSNGSAIERFGLGGGASIAMPIGLVSGTINIQIENATNLERLYLGVHQLFDLEEESQHDYFASIEPYTEALPVFAAVFLGGVAAGAKAYEAGE